MADSNEVKEKKKKKTSVKPPSKTPAKGKWSVEPITNGTAGDDNVEAEEMVTVVATNPVEASSEEEPSQDVSVDVQLKLQPVEKNEVDLAPSQTDQRYVVPAAASKKDIQLLKDIDDNKLLELKEAFVLFDLNQDGYIDRHDLINTFRSLGQPDVPESEIQKMLAEAPNPLDFDGFVILLGYRTIELDPEETLVEALSQWDYDNSGLISEERIRHDLMTWGDRFSTKEVDVALEDAPVYINKGRAMIDYIKFCNTLCGLRKKSKVSPSERF